MSRIVTVRQEISSMAYRPRQSLRLPAATTAGQLVQVSTTDVFFERAFFYGLSAVPVDGKAVTANAGSVFLGEKDAAGTSCPDEVTNDASNPVLVVAEIGTCLNLKDFWVRIPTVGDALFVKYQ